MKKNSATAIIFDFDGTIADSFLTTLQIIYETAHSRLMPNEDISRLRSMGMYQVLRELRVPWWRYIFLIKRIRRIMRNDLNKIMPVAGLSVVIESLQKKHKLFILSSNSISNIRAFLQQNDMDSYFSGIYGNISPFRKEHKLEAILQQNGLSKQLTWYVGDESQDIKAANRLGINSIAVAWGFSNIHVLERCHPTALIFDPSKLNTLFSKQ